MTSMTRARTSGQPGELFGSGFELFADVLSLGLATTVACLPLVTVPAAMSTACGQLRRRAAEGAPVGAAGYARQLIGRLRRGRGDLLAGVTALLGACVIVLDLMLATAGLPGGSAVATVVSVVTAALLAVALRAVALPESEQSWKPAIRTAARASVADPAGSALLLAAVGTAALCAWILLPALALVLGPLAMAATAVEIRRTRT
jgi:hypothetical protein